MALACESDDVLGERRHPGASDVGKPLAGKSTLNRMDAEAGAGQAPAVPED